MRAKHAEYTLKVLPESLKQNIATPVIQDLLLIHRPWTFNISQVPQHLASATHIWHGSDDAMVSHFSSLSCSYIVFLVRYTAIVVHKVLRVLWPDILALADWACCVLDNA